VTSKDKTADQLVASIRKSKSGEVARKTAKKTARRPATRKPSTRNSGAKAKSSPASPGGYQSGKRVWPD